MVNKSFFKTFKTQTGWGDKCTMLQVNWLRVGYNVHGGLIYAGCLSNKSQPFELTQHKSFNVP